METTQADVLAIFLMMQVATAQTDPTLVVKQEPSAVYDNLTGQYHVQLTCTSHGRQPSAVIWTTPSHQTMKVSNKSASEFSLLLPNPVSGGNYTCHIPPDSPAAKDSPALEGATVFVDDVRARLMLMEAEQSALRRENLDLKHQVVTLENEQSALRHQMQVLEKTVVFYAYLPQEKYLHHGDVIILTSVTINQGNAYNSSTGEFTAPYNGTYFFTATASSARYSNTTDYYANVYVMVDYFTVTAVWTKSVSWYEMATCTYPIHLAKGQRVWLQAVDDGDFAGPNTSFSGFLLHADD